MMFKYVFLVFSMEVPFLLMIMTLAFQAFLIVPKLMEFFPVPVCTGYSLSLELRV
jgi:hypothetical protein